MQKAAKLTRLIPIIVVTVLLWAPLYPVLAEDSSSSANNTSARVGARLSLLDQRKADITQRIEQFREKIGSREAQLKDRLAKFRDQEKAKIAERVSENLNKINKNRTDEMGKHLDTLSDILGRVELRASGSATSSGVQSSIASASAAISAAHNAVNTQSQIDYTIAATSESGLNGEVKAKRDQLLKDLGGVRKAVLDARQAVINAIRATAQNKGSN